MHWFRPFEVFQQETSNAVMGALLLNDISNKKVRVITATISTVTTSTVAAADATGIALITTAVSTARCIVSCSTAVIVLELFNTTALTAASVRTLLL
jgi:hypothetical protein